VRERGTGAFGLRRTLSFCTLTLSVEEGEEGAEEA
jgi:hypothetical protein